MTSTFAQALPGADPAAAMPAVAVDPNAYAPDLAELRKMLDDAMTLTTDARKESQIDEDMYHGVQWTPEELRVLRARKQPSDPFNRIRPAINGTLGVIKQGQTDPRAYPRNPQDEDSSDVASKILRFIADKNRFKNLKLRAARDYLVPGTMAAIVEVDDDRQIIVTSIRFEEFFYDPRSRREDFGDARYLGIAKWQWADDVAKAYPEKKTEVEAAVSGGSGLPVLDDTMQDRPAGRTAWSDIKTRRILVVEIYHLDGGVWRRCKFHAGGVLEADSSAYLDSRGRPICPIEAQSCYVDRENNRYGMSRDMRGPQNEINKRRSKLLNELNSRQIRQVEIGAAVTDVDAVKAEAAKPDGALPYGWDVVQRVDIVAGQAQLLAEAKGEIERYGPNPAILGRQGESQSGRANLIRQQAGLTELATVFDGIEDWELRVYRQMWNRARQFWTAPQFIRITDDEGAPGFIGINQPKGEPIIDQQTGQPTVDPRTGEPMEGPPPINPQTGEPVLGYKNRLAELDVDIDIDTTPDTANLQAEQFALLSELAKQYGPQEVPFEDLLEASSLPNKRELLEKRKAKGARAARPAAQPRGPRAGRGVGGEG